MAYGNSKLTKTDLFIKSSHADLQDPIFLTFDLDFFPVREEFPRYDGLTNNNLLVAPISAANDLNTDTVHTRSSFDTTNPNSTVEYAAYDWLWDYYGPNYNSMFNSRQPHPATALLRVITGLQALQSSPWYFQSVQGIPDLWKQAHRIKEGNMKATLTFNCLESIRQPLTDIAENYRYAVYDSERLSYRLPDNLRWFDMDIHLIEARNLVDHGSGFSIASLIFGGNNENDLFQKDKNGRVISGLKIIRFKCKMCEFDFSEFLAGSGSATEFTISTPDKAFTPNFKINVGWVIQDEILDGESEDIRQSGILSGAFNALSNRLSNAISAISNLPNVLVGSAAASIQSKLTGFALGNAYDTGGLNGISNAINKFGAAITGRQAPVGPTIADATNTPIYPGSRVTSGGKTWWSTQAEVKAQALTDKAGDLTEMDVYPAIGPTPPVNNLGDLYPLIGPPRPVKEMGDLYPAIGPTPPVNNLGDLYPPVKPTPPVTDLGDTYP